MFSPFNKKARNCDYYGDPENYITKDGTYPVKGEAIRRQRLKCHAGGHRFSETKYSPLFGHGETFREYEQTAKMTGYGLSVAQIADVLERDERTILAWQKALARKCKTFHLSVCSLIGLVLTYLQMDEIWSYCQSKKRQMWVFIALEAQTKFWINFEVGSRTARTAERLLKNLVYLMPWGIPNFLLVTTDKLAAYEKAISQIFRKVRYAYLQVVKQRRKHWLVTVKQEIVKGESEDFGNRTRNTSYIERFNLTLRQKVAYLHRKTLGYCKSQANLRSCLWINLFDYNYGRFHPSLRLEINAGAARFRKRYVHQTPAMRMGLTATRLTWRDLIIALIPENAHNFGSLTVW